MAFAVLRARLPFARPVAAALLAALLMAGPEVAHGQITVGSDGANTTDNTFYSGGNTLTKIGTNEVKLTNTGNSFTGNVTVTTGTLAGQGGLGTNPGTTVFGATGNEKLITVQGGAALNMYGSDVLGNADTSNQRTIVIENGGLVLSTNALSAIGSVTLNGGTLRGNGGVSFNSVNTATYQINGNITTGGTAMSTFDAAAGTSFNNFYLSNVGSRITTFSVADATAGTDLLVNVTLGDGWGGVDSGVVKSGAGTMVLAAENAYEGTTTISAGVLQIGNSGTAGSIASISAITNNASLVVNRSNAITLANAIGGTGNLTNSGSGTLTLSNANTFTGTTQALAGGIALTNVNALAGSTLRMESSDAGAVSFGVPGTQTYVIGGLTGGRNLDNAGNTLSIGSNGQSTTYSGTLSGAGGLTKAGAGTLTLTGSSGYAGATAINAGVLSLGSAGALGTAGTINFGGGTLQYSSANSTDYSARFGTGGTQAYSIDTNGQDVSFGSALGAGSGSLTKLGGGTLTLTQNSAYNGTTTISGGTLAVGAGGTAGSINGSGNITNNAAILFNRSDAVSVSGLISGSGRLVKAGAGNLTLSNVSNTFTGDVVVSSGTLTGSVGTGGNDPTTTVFGAVGSGRLITVQNGGTLDMTVSNVLGHAATTNQRSIVIENGGVVQSTGALSALGPVTLNGGTLRGNGGVNLGAGVTATFQLNGSITTGGTARSTFDAVAGTPDNNFYLSNAGTRITTFDVADAAAGTDLLVAVPLGDGWGGVSSSLTKVGAGTIALAAASTYSGSTTISAGTFQLGVGGTAGSLASGGIINNAALVFNRSNALTVGGIISGTGTVTQAGTGVTSLTAANTYSGPTTIASGTLQVGNGGTTGSLGSGPVSNAATLAFNRSDALTVSTTISGTGSLAQVGTGITSLTANNTYTGVTVISSGTLQVGTGGTAGSLGSGPVTLNAALSMNRSDAVTLANDLAGTGSFVQTGAGTTTLTGSNAYTGGTRLAAGVIALGSANALGSSGTISFAGGTLRATSANAADYSGRFSTAANQAFSIDTNGQDVSFGSALTSSGGSLTKLGAGTLTLTQNSSYSGATTISGGTLQVGNGGSSGSIGSGAVANNGTLLFNRSGTYSVGNTISGTGTVVQANVGTLVISAANSYTGGTRVDAGTVRFTQALGVANNASNVFTVNTGTIQFTVSDVFGVSETVIVTPLVVNAGGLIDNQGGYNRLGPVTLNGGELRGTGVASGLSIALTGVTVNGGATTSLISGTGMALGAGTDVANVTFTVADGAAANDLLVTAGLIDGPGVPWPNQKTSSLTKTGAGRMTLAGANTYSGSTTISAGTLQVGDGGTTGSLPTGAVINNAALVFNRSDALAVGAAISGTGTVTQAGTGVTSLTAANTYSGPTTIASGTLQVGNGGTTGSLGSGPVSNAATLAFNRSDALTVSTTISGTGTLAQVGTGITSLAADNAYSGPTLISSGTLQVGTGGTTGSLGSGPVTLNAALSYNRSDAVTLSHDLAGTGSFVQTGSGTTTLTGNNSYTGGTRIAGGALALGSASALGSTGTISFAGGTLRVTSANTTDYSGRFSTAANQAFSIDTNGETITFNSALTSSGGSLTKLGAGTLTLTQDSAYSGTTLVSTGTLQVGNGGAGGSLGAGVITNNGRIVFNRGDAALTYSANVAGTGGVTYSGTGVTTVNAYSTYTGSTIVEAGTVIAASQNLVQNPVDGALGANGNDKYVYVRGGATLKFVSSDILGSHRTTNQRTMVIENGGTLVTGTALTPLYNVTLQGGSIVGAGGINLGANEIGVYQMNGTITTSGTSLSRIVDSGTGANNRLLLAATGSRITTFDVADATAGTDLLVDMVIDDAWTEGAASLTKTGPGTMTITRDSLYTGSTTVSSGTLQVGDGGAGGSLGSGAITNNATIDFRRGDASLTYSANIAGIGTVIYSGTGVTSVNTYSTYTGPTIVAAGTVVATSQNTTVNPTNGALGANGNDKYVYVLSGATLRFNSSDILGSHLTTNQRTFVVENGATLVSGTALTPLGPVQLNGGTLVGAGGVNLGPNDIGVYQANGTITVGGTSMSRVVDSGTGSSNRFLLRSVGGAAGRVTTLDVADVAAGTDLLMDMVMDDAWTEGASGLTKTGAGRMTVTRDALYTGTTTISAGELELGNGGTAGSLAAQSSLVNNAALVFNRSDAVSFGNQIPGTGLVVQRGSGTTSLTGSNTFSGGTRLEAGALELGSATAIGTSGTIAFVGGTLRSSTANTGDYSARFSTEAGQLYRLDTNGQAITAASPLSSVGGTLTKLGAGTLSLTAANTYSGATTIVAGTLQVGAGGTSGSLGSGPVTDDGTLAFNRSDAYAFAAAIGGSGSVLQLGSGTTTLSGANAYAGATQVAAGVLRINGDSSLATGPVTVAAGATLGGTGRIGGAVSVSGVLSPGASVETLATGALSFAAGSTFAYEVDSTAPLAAAGDLVVSSGGLSIAATSSLTLTDLASTPAAIPQNTVLTLVNYAGSWDGGLFSYGGTPLANGDTFTTGTQQWVIRYDATSGGVNFPGEYAGANFLNITAVPEPSTAAILGIAGLAIGAVIRRRRWSR